MEKNQQTSLAGRNLNTATIKPTLYVKLEITPAVGSIECLLPQLYYSPTDILVSQYYRLKLAYHRYIDNSIYVL